ncbi:hypothetical protein Fcan01_22865 [Folsomia candida]|uniref:Uncharacterized protein n=1 Tax=Folsomia candida TaxID=158441 RepID=A0A226DCJ8_FOLCA|nr:hypothetical protein Fcan01_22865 [Folsomia candida]
MFNARTLNIIRISMKIYSALGSTPLTWDSDGGHISVCETGRRKVTFFMAVVHIFVHLCFLFWRLGQLSRERNPSFQTAVWLWIWIMLGFWHLVTSYNGWTKKWESWTYRLISTSGKIQIFQKFQILTTYYNHASIWLLAPVICVFSPAGLVISCAFGSIRFHSFLPLFEYIPFPVLSNNGLVILALTLLPSAAIYEASNKLLPKIRADGNGKIIRRRLMALHLFGVKKLNLKLDYLDMKT